LGDGVAERALDVLRTASRRGMSEPMLLVAYYAPERWGGEEDRIIWTAIRLREFDTGSFKHPPKKGGLRQSSFPSWPSVQKFKSANRELAWIGRCTDISRESLTSRSEAEFRALKVAVVGVGALGSVTARAIVPLHPERLVLLDKEELEPGNLLRHEGLSIFVERNKAEGLASVFESIYVNEQTLGVVADATRVGLDQIGDCNLLVDATADPGVHARLLSSQEFSTIPMAICYVKPGPDFGVLFLRRPASEKQFEEAETALWEGFDENVRARFSETDERVVWPEPGCYYPTFPASYHRLRLMADSFLETTLSWWRDQTNDLITLYGQVQWPGLIGTETRILRQVTV
jgi:hypothetical protein